MLLDSFVALRSDSGVKNFCLANAAIKPLATKDSPHSVNALNLNASFSRLLSFLKNSEGSDSELRSIKKLIFQFSKDSYEMFIEENISVITCSGLVRSLIDLTESLTYATESYPQHQECLEEAASLLIDVFIHVRERTLKRLSADSEESLCQKEELALLNERMWLPARSALEHAFLTFNKKPSLKLSRRLYILGSLQNLNYENLKFSLTWMKKFTNSKSTDSPKVVAFNNVREFFETEVNTEKLTKQNVDIKEIREEVREVFSTALGDERLPEKALEKIDRRLIEYIQKMSRSQKSLSTLYTDKDLLYDCFVLSSFLEDCDCSEKDFLFGMSEGYYIQYRRYSKFNEAISEKVEMIQDVSFYMGILCAIRGAQAMGLSMILSSILLPEKEVTKFFADLVLSLRAKKVETRSSEFFNFALVKLKEIFNS